MRYLLLRGLVSLLRNYPLFTAAVSAVVLILIFINATTKHIKPLNIQVQLMNKHSRYILLWTARDVPPFHSFGDGQQAFIKNKCNFSNCFVTTNRSLWNGDLTRFHAIVFNGRSLENLTEVPTQRSPLQKYIYVNMESPDYHPICRKEFDNFFNLTATYRLDSDIVFTYFTIKNSSGEVVGPKPGMTWISDKAEVKSHLVVKLQKKRHAVVWLVSHCVTVSRREAFIAAFRTALSKYRLRLDIYGACGSYMCPKNDTGPWIQDSSCDRHFGDEYYFYVAAENSFSKDYVTEKLTRAMRHDMVPIVFGGANYGRFLPPGSYLDGQNQTVDQLAAIVAKTINSFELYVKYFGWKGHYYFDHAVDTENVCSLCSAVNDEPKRPKVYSQLRRWWNPDYKERCKFPRYFNE